MPDSATILRSVAVVGSLLSAIAGTSVVTNTNTEARMQVRTDAAVLHLIDENRRLQRELSSCNDR